MNLARVWMCLNRDDESGILKSFLSLADDEACREVILGGYSLNQLSIRDLEHPDIVDENLLRKKLKHQ